MPTSILLEPGQAIIYLALCSQKIGSFIERALARAGWDAGAAVCPPLPQSGVND